MITVVAELKVLDESQLECLAEAAGIEGVRAILDAFWESTAELSSELCTAVASNDAQNIAALGHALKGSSANMGAALLANRARSIEEAAKSGNMSDARIALTNFPKDIAETRQAIDEILARYS